MIEDDKKPIYTAMLEVQAKVIKTLAAKGVV